MGVTIDIKGSHSIEIKCWTPAFEASLHNIYITARGHPVIHRHINNPPPAHMTQRILIKRGRNGSNPSIEGDHLTIPFHALLFNQPGEGEGDFVFTAEMLLHDLAERVWDAIDDVETIKTKKRENHHTE